MIFVSGDKFWCFTMFDGEQECWKSNTGVSVLVNIAVFDRER